MRKHILRIIIFSCFLLLCTYASNSVFAQTPGLIYKPAINGGNKVLDPNGDGYTSRSQYGFIGGDEGATYSEIPYKPFPVFMDEPVSDLGTGPNGGHTDYAPRIYNGTTPVGSPLAAYFDGTNFLFRIRLGGQSTASKGYSILIDANNNVSGTSPNPGFEYEVVLCTNFDVRIYYHGADFTKEGPVIFNGSVDQFSQKSIAASTGNNDPDYFYDFYVPVSAFNRSPVITGSTQLRMTGVTVTSAKSGLFGTASDIGGLDDTKYNGGFIDALKAIINGTPQTSPGEIENNGFPQILARSPIVNDPIYTNNTTISGVSSESAGTRIDIFRNGTSIGFTTVNSSGVWTLSTAGITLVTGNSITATASPTGKSTSPASTAVIVQNTPTSGSGCTEPPSVESMSNSDKAFNINTSTSGTITIYRTFNSSPSVYGTYNATVSGPHTLNAGNITLAAGATAPDTNGKFPNGTYHFTLTPTNGGCTSANSNPASTSCNNYTTTSTPTISPATITTKDASVTINGPINSTWKLLRNGIQIATIPVSSPATAWTVSLTDLEHGDVLNARAIATADCSAPSNLSTAVNVTILSTAPSISGTYCGTATAVNGTTTEPAGTTIRLYNGSTTTLLGTTTATPHPTDNTYRTWSISGLNLNGVASITATATAAKKGESARSTASAIGSPMTVSSLAITSVPVVEGTTSLRGTAPANSTVTLYINKDPYVIATGPNAGNRITATANSSGNWEFTNISPFEFYAGASLTVTAKTGSNPCESFPSGPVIVECQTVGAGMTASLSATTLTTTTTICPKTRALVYLSSSEIGIIYSVYRKTGSTSYAPYGPSVLGTGNPLTLQSDSVTTTGTVLQVRTIKVGASCQQNIGSELTVNLYPAVKNDFVLSASISSGCPGLTTVITLQNATNIYSYQLINSNTKEKIGSAVIPSTPGPANITFPPITVNTTTTYSVIITRIDGGCVAQNINSNTVTITIAGPTVNQSVTPSSATICTQQSVSFNFTTQGSNFNYILIDKSTNSEVGTAIPGNNGTGTLSTGILTTEGVRNYRIKVSQNSGCTSYLITEPSVNVTNNPAVPVNAGPDQIICGSSTTLQSSNPAPGTGAWTVISKPFTAVDPTFSNTTVTNPTVSGLASGTYIFRWTVSTTCGTPTSTFDEVTITRNCPAALTVNTTKFYDEYNVGDILAIVSDDIDGGIISYTAINGIRPPGSDFALENNKLVLKVTTIPSNGGSYSFTMRTTDAKGMTTNTPMLVRMYERESIPGAITPFPVELKYFRAISEKRLVLLNWETASEKNNDRFEVQRSADGIKFYKIGSIQGSGTTSRSVKYTFTDTEPMDGLTYYRLKQIDFNGEHAISQLASVKFKGLNSDMAKHSVKAYPNPFANELTVAIHATENETSAMLQVIDMQGRIVLTNTIQLKKNLNYFDVKLPGSQKGMYIVKITGTGINSSIKIVKTE